MATTSGGAATTMFPSLERPTSDGEVPNPDLRPEQTARWLKQQDKTKEKKRRKSNKVKHRMTIHGHTGSGSTAANASNDRIRFRTESKKSKNGVRIYSTVKDGSFSREKSSSRFDVATTRERDRTEQDARIEAAEAMSALATGIFSSETNRSSTSSRPASNEDSSDDGGNPLVIDCSVGDSHPQIVQQLPVGQQEDKDSSSSKKVHWGSKKSPHLQSILEQETLKEKSDVNASKNNDISGAALRTHSPVVLFGFANVNTLDPKLAGLYQHRGVVLPVRPELHGNKSVNTVSASAVCQPASNLKHMYLPVVAPALRSDLPRGGMLSTPMPDYQPPTKISRTVETQTSGSSASQEKQTVISPIPDLHTLSLGTNDANTPQTAKIEMGNEMLTDVVEILPRDSILLNKPRCRAEKADSHTGMLHNNLASSHNTTAEDSLVTNMPQPYVIQHLPSVSNTSNNLSAGKGRMLRQGHQSWPSVTSIHSSDSGKTTGNSSQPSDTTEPMDIDQSLRLAQKQALQRLNDNLTRAAPSERAFMLGQILAIVTMQKRNRLNPRQHSPTDNAARSVSPAQTMEISSSPISPVGQPAGQSTRHVPPALGTAQSAASPPEIRVQETSPKRKNPAKELIKLKPGEPKWPDSGLHPSIDSSSLPLVKSEKIRPENRPLSRNALPFSETAFYSNSSPILPLNPSFRQKAFSRPTPPSPTPKLIYSATNLSPHESGNESTTSHNNQSMSRSPSHSPSPRLAEQIATADSNNGSHLPFKKRRMANYSENTESLDACNVAKTRSPQTSEAIPPTIHVSSVVTPVDSSSTAPQERSSDPLFAQARSAAASGGPPEVSRGRSSAPHLPVRSSDTLQVTATDLTLPKTINPVTASPVNSVRTGRLPDIVPRVEDIKIALLPDEDGDVPLHIAVAHGNVAAAKHYVELMRLGNRSVDVVNKDRQIPLHIAVITNHLAVLRLLLKAGANVNFPNNIGQSSVHLAARRGHCNCLGTLVEMSRQEVQLNKKDFEGYSPLHLAVQKGHADAVSALIHHKADTNVQDGKSGRTPLFHASETNQVGIVDILLKAGAKVNTMNYAGSTAVMAASSRGYKDVVTLLTQYGADTKGTNIADLTAKGPPVRNSTNAALRHTVISPFPNSDDGKRVREKNKNTSQ